VVGRSVRVAVSLARRHIAQGRQDQTVAIWARRVTRQTHLLGVLRCRRIRPRKASSRARSDASAVDIDYLAVLIPRSPPPLLRRAGANGRSRETSAATANGWSWPVAEIDPVRPKPRLADEALAANVNSRAGSRRRITSHQLTLADIDWASDSDWFLSFDFRVLRNLVDT